MSLLFVNYDRGIHSCAGVVDGDVKVVRGLPLVAALEYIIFSRLIGFSHISD